VFEWEQHGAVSTGVYLASGNWTNARQLVSGLNPQPVWCDSKKIFITGDEKNVELINDSGHLVQAFRPENKDKLYCAFSLSPDIKKILLVEGSPQSYNFKTYISNTHGSKLKGNISHYYGDNPDNTNLLTKEFWEPNGSRLLVNQ
jgi:hypothetical protein